MGMIYNAPRQSGKSTFILKKAHEQWAKCQYYKKQCWDKSSDVTKVYTRPPDEPLILVSNSRTVLFLKEEYYKMYGIYPAFTICTLREFINKKNGINNTRYKVYIDNAEIVFNEMLKLLGLSEFDTAVMTVPTVTNFKDMD